MNGQLEDFLCEMRRVCLQEPERVFPYDEFKTLKRLFAADFAKLSRMDLITADFNEHLMLVSGLASGGIHRLLTDPAGAKGVRTLLSGDFWERYPQYGFLKAANLENLPNLSADLEHAERLRLLILEALSLLLEGRQNSCED